MDPIFIQGKVVSGFGRGSSELGIPTANYSEDVVDSLKHLNVGIYYGFAKVDSDFVDNKVHPMVMSIGWNPFYKNKHKSAEVHIINRYSNDFYNQNMKCIILGYLRPEVDFESIDKLIETIKSDIEQAITLCKDKKEFINNRFFIN